MAIVTGASRGIGRAIAERLAVEGTNLVVNYLTDESGARSVVKDIEAIGPRAVAARADVSRFSDLEGLFQETIHHFGRLDIVVANAAIELIDTPFVDYTEAQYDLVFDLNAKGTFFTMQLAAKHISDGGRIVVISSNTAALSLPGFAVYGASKTAARYFVQVLAKELGPRQITVNSVSPGVTKGAGVFTSTSEDDPYLQHMIDQTPLNRLGTPEDVAGAVAFLVSDEAGFITGHHLSIDGGAAL